MVARSSFSEAVEAYRDQMWFRDPELRVEDVHSAERFIEGVGFCATLTDSRRPGPSLYIAVCGRRDAHLPRNIQKDPESRLAWSLKDELIRRGRVYYGKLVKGRSTLAGRRLVPFFNAIWGVPRQSEAMLLSQDARVVLEVLRCEWEMATRDLHKASGLAERARFLKALDELQRTLKVIPADSLYEPGFTYIWTLLEARFDEELKAVVSREDAIQELARAFLHGAGATFRGELSKVTGLSRSDTGLGNWSLVEEGFATRIAPGVYRLSEFNSM